MSRQHFAPPQAPRRIRLDEGLLVLPPVTLRDLPPEARLGTFMGIAALRFSTRTGGVAVFLHDLGDDDIGRVLSAQREQAEAQLGADYARRAFWWEKP